MNMADSILKKYKNKDLVLAVYSQIL